MGEKLGYRPALDGVRAVSIALVLVFHLGAPWLEGGYLGVSVFFTLSGFLITSLLLHEREHSLRIDVKAFYVRRLRRLMPASLLCLFGIALLAWLEVITPRADLRGGVLASLFQVANWEHLVGHRSYADLFVAPSPIDHFWSLAIEEQFYWLWPLAIAGLTALAARRLAPQRTIARVLVGAYALLGVGAFVTARVAGGDAAYFASWARFAEILAGAALAAVLARREVPQRAAHLALPCLLGIVVLAALTPAGRGWAYEGGLPLFALLSVGLILGVQADGPIARLLSREPIPWIGRISYGLYLFHWPVFTIMGDAGVVVKLSTTFAITIVSFYAVERPIRTGRVLQLPTLYLQAAAFSLIAVAGVAAAVVPAPHRAAVSAAPVVMGAGATSPLVADPGSPPTTTMSSAPISATLDEHGKVARPPSTTTTMPPSPRVVAMFGDSIADWLLRDSAFTFTRTDMTLIDAAVEGCDGAIDIPEARGRLGQILPLPDDCKEWIDAYPAVVQNDALPVDVAVLMVGNAPIVDRHVQATRIGPCDSLDWYVTDLAQRVMYLRQHVDEVVFVLPSWGGKKASFLSTDDHLIRSGCIRSAMRELAGRLGVDTIDMAEELCPAGPEGECTDLRERDGTHIDPDDAPTVLDWLLDHIPAR
jgi:peptidoglycan/LPS O-acetylase OafA/YrhL